MKTHDTFQIGPNISDILFLDDMEERHRAFMNKFGMRDGLRIWQARSATEAIDILKKVRDHGRIFAQVFLDHDLSIDDIMCPPGGPSKVPTGMDVVDFIINMDLTDQPREVYAHTLNPPAAQEMVRRLSDANFVTKWVPFDLLVR